ncbi:MAG: DNA alkylation repair protein [Rhodocyclaceae bacterium]|nr:DNA alkylation repair protein [Rhodocyclaceae bacterium]
MANDSTRKSKLRRSAVRAVLRAKPAKDSDIAAIVQSVAAMGSKQAAFFAPRFFKTEDGEYGAGDKFLGVRMPTLRQFARTVGDAGLDVALPLLKSGWHETRALALLLMVRAYENGDSRLREAVYRAYLRHTNFINNWDLVDLSAAPIVGAWLADKPKERKSVLTRLAKSKVIWERRIAILATYHNIRNGEATETFRLARLLLHDREDLIHKAVGWMLREVGRRIGEDTQERFLKDVYHEMPRTMLRYAIERFPEAKRQRYLRALA